MEGSLKLLGEKGYTEMMPYAKDRVLRVVPNSAGTEPWFLHWSNLGIENDLQEPINPLNRIQFIHPF